MRSLLVAFFLIIPVSVAGSLAPFFAGCEDELIDYRSEGRQALVKDLLVKSRGQAFIEGPVAAEILGNKVKFSWLGSTARNQAEYELPLDEGHSPQVILGGHGRDAYLVYNNGGLILERRGLDLEGEKSFRVDLKRSVSRFVPGFSPEATLTPLGLSPNGRLFVSAVLLKAGSHEQIVGFMEELGNRIEALEKWNRVISTETPLWIKGLRAQFIAGKDRFPGEVLGRDSHHVYVKARADKGILLQMDPQTVTITRHMPMSDWGEDWDDRKLLYHFEDGMIYAAALSAESTEVRVRDAYRDLREGKPR